jgi:hypothetical protein
MSRPMSVVLVVPQKELPDVEQEVNHILRKHLAVKVFPAGKAVDGVSALQASRSPYRNTPRRQQRTCSYNCCYQWA